MESIDRLREYLDKNVRKLPHTEWIANEPMELRPSRIYGYIDAIEQEVDDMWHALTIDAKPMTDENMAESGWLRLPLDAEGEYIRIGDVMERGEARGQVIALMLSEYPKEWGGGLHWGVQLEGEQAPTALDALFHHHHAPTVEDVLMDLLADFAEQDERDGDMSDLVAEYAAKLRLAGDE